MNKEELQKYLNTDEGKSWFHSFVSGLGYKSPEEVEKEKEGIASKNREVIEQNKKLKEQFEAVQSKTETLDKVKDLFNDYEVAVDDEGNLDYDGIEKALSKLKSTGNADPSKIEEMQRQLKRAQRDVEQQKKEVTGRDNRLQELQQQIEKDQSEIQRLLVDGAFKEALQNHNYNSFVVSNILPALRAKSNAQLQFNEEKGQYEAITDDGRAIHEWIDMWKDTEEGKALRMSPVNSGGGSRGSGSGTGGQKSFKEMTAQERLQLYKENPDLYRKMKNQS
jgi:phage shock protein A